MARLRTSTTITVTVELPARDWPEHIKPPAHPSCAAVRLLRGCLTGRQAVMVIRIEGFSPGIQEVLRYWERQDFTVTADARKEPKGRPRNAVDRRRQGLQGRGIPFGSSPRRLSPAAAPAM